MWSLCPAGAGIEKPIGEAVLQIDMMLGKERKINVRGETSSIQNTHTFRITPWCLNDIFKSVNCIAYYTNPDLFLIQILTLIQHRRSFTISYYQIERQKLLLN